MSSSRRMFLRNSALAMVGVGAVPVLVAASSVRE